jgi:hypothetical protein
MSTEKEKFYYHQRNPLAATCILHKAQEFTRIEAHSILDVKSLAEKDPTLYHNIGLDIDRGFRITTDPRVVGIFQVLESHCNAVFRISYIGKAQMTIYLPHDDVSVLRKEVEAIRELMQQPLEIGWGGGACFTVTAPVEKIRRDDQHGRTRSIPVVSHCFQQVRPLVIKYLQKHRHYRENMLVTWRDKPNIRMHWSY